MYCRSWYLTENLQVPDHPVIHPFDYSVSMLIIKLKVERSSSLYPWTPMGHWFHCRPWIYIFWIWVTWNVLPWRGLPCNWLTYGSWRWIVILSMSKVFPSGLTMSLLLLNWYLGVPLLFLMPSGFQSFWTQPIIIKVSDIGIITISTLEVLKGDQLWLNWRFLILYCMDSLKIVIKVQMKLRADVFSLLVLYQDHCGGM